MIPAVGHLPSILVPPRGIWRIYLSPPPGTCHLFKKNANARGWPGGGGMGTAGIDWCITLICYSLSSNVVSASHDILPFSPSFNSCDQLFTCMIYTETITITLVSVISGWYLPHHFCLDKYMLCFNFILGSIFIFLCFILITIHYHTQKQMKIKIEPRIKLNHNIYTTNENKQHHFYVLHSVLHLNGLSLGYKDFKVNWLYNMTRCLTFLTLRWNKG